MLKHSLSVLAITALTSGVVSAQNDECTTAMAVGLGTTAFDTTLATLSAQVWPCAIGGGPDLWYTYTAANTNDLRFETCGSTYDTALEIFTGSCGALVSVECNDDDCSLQSGIFILSPVAGRTYTVRIGGWQGATGAGILTVAEQNAPPPPPPPPVHCAETIFDRDNAGNAGGALYFDITVAQAISVAGILSNTDSTGVVGMTVFTTPGTYVGQENNLSAWTQVAEDDGTSTGLGLDMMTPYTFVTPFMLAPGTYGIALVAENTATGGMQRHDYTNGTATNITSMSADGVISLSLGAATSAPFTGGIFSPRVWNGRICSDTPISPGTNYCTATVNSTGVTAVMRANGSDIVTNNDLVLEASGMPLNSFGLFLTSTSQGFVAMPGGSVGNLCLAGTIGRYVGPGQILNSGTTGAISLAVDNTLQPSPTGPITAVAGDTWNYQAWYRDAVGGVATSNFTDGLEITYQ